MKRTAEIEEIYNKLPQAAQREALDFMAFLEQRYVETDPPPTDTSTPPEAQLTSRGRLLFISGSLTGDVDTLLQQQRDARLDILLQRVQR